MCASSVEPKVSLSASEWCMMSKLIQILQPLEEATRELSTEQRVSCSKVILLLNALLFELRKNVVDDETQVSNDNETQVPESQGSSVSSSEESQQVIAGLIELIECRWLNYEGDRIYSICALLDPRFKDVCFTNAALIRAKRLLLSIMCPITQGDLLASSTSVANDGDDEEDVPIRKKTLCGTVLINSKRRNLLIYQLIKTKMRKNCPHTAALSTSRERRILWHGGRKT